jgi:hypothetical protein
MPSHENLNPANEYLKFAQECARWAIDVEDEKVRQDLLAWQRHGRNLLSAKKRYATDLPMRQILHCVI